MASPRRPPQLPVQLEPGAHQVVAAARVLPRLDDSEVPVVLLDALHGPVTHAPPLMIRERLIVLVVLQCHPSRARVVRAFEPPAAELVEAIIIPVAQGIVGEAEGTGGAEVDGDPRVPQRGEGRSGGEVHG